MSAAALRGNVDRRWIAFSGGMRTMPPEKAIVAIRLEQASRPKPCQQFSPSSNLPVTNFHYPAEKFFASEP